jgi:hypothetical protein
MIGDLPMVLVSGAAGLGLGVLNAWGLWVTSRHVTHAKFPGVLVLVSLLARTLVPLLLLLLMAQGLLPRLIAGIGGLIVGRLVTVRALARSHHGSHGGEGEREPKP